MVYFLAEMSTKFKHHMQQSSDWNLFRKALGKNVVYQSGNDWFYNATLENGDGRFGKYFKRLYCPYGPVAANKQSYKESLDSLTDYATKHDVDFIRIEITDNPSFIEVARQSGFSKARRLSQPDLTLHIDLRRDTDAILKNMSKTNQYLWRKAPDNGIIFKHSYKATSLKPLNDMLKETSKRSGAVFHGPEYYNTLIRILGPKKSAGIAYAYHNNKPIVGAIFFDDIDQKTRYYMYAYSFDSARKLSANSPLLTYLILDAKKQGLNTFDMFGVSPLDQPNHRWAGFSKFKRTFGGTEVIYGGTWEKPIRQVRYNALNFARKISN
jgi:lipid II:glycine glycyltransferase (peptidoglycan interpeptide bridge formation enzyme)